MSDKPENSEKPTEICESSLNGGLTGVVDAAYAVAHFAKFNEYPKECSSEFVEFTEKINRLEIELKKAGYPLSS